MATRALFRFAYHSGAARAGPSQAAPRAHVSQALSPTCSGQGTDREEAAAPRYSASGARDRAAHRLPGPFSELPGAEAAQGRSCSCPRKRCMSVEHGDGAGIAERRARAQPADARKPATRRRSRGRGSQWAAPPLPLSLPHGSKSDGGGNRGGGGGAPFRRCRRPSRLSGRRASCPWPSPRSGT